MMRARLEFVGVRCPQTGRRGSIVAGVITVCPDGTFCYRCRHCSEAHDFTIPDSWKPKAQMTEAAVAPPNRMGT